MCYTIFTVKEPPIVNRRYIMKENTKNFSWTLKIRDEDGTTDTYNVTNTARGYRQGWYKTPESATKALKAHIALAKKCHPNAEIIEAYCFTRSGERF
jgi:hypothetical protein